VSVKVSEEVVDELGGGGVAIPLPDVEGQEGFVGMGLGVL
jgi:hypothetical protein